MSLWVTPIFFGIYFLVAIMIARLRAELGFLVHDLHYIDPHNTLVTVFGTRRLGSSTLTVFSLYQFFNRAYRAHPMPPQLEGLKIAERRNINPRHIAAAILLATLIGSVSVFWVLLDNYYRHGAETGVLWTMGIRVRTSHLSSTRNMAELPPRDGSSSSRLYGRWAQFRSATHVSKNTLSVVAPPSTRLCHGK